MKEGGLFGRFKKHPHNVTETAEGETVAEGNSAFAKPVKRFEKYPYEPFPINPDLEIIRGLAEGSRRSPPNHKRRR